MRMSVSVTAATVRNGLLAENLRPLAVDGGVDEIRRAAGDARGAAAPTGVVATAIPVALAPSAGPRGPADELGEESLALRGEEDGVVVDIERRLTAPSATRSAPDRVAATRHPTTSCAGAIFSAFTAPTSGSRSP